MRLLSRHVRRRHSTNRGSPARHRIQIPTPGERKPPPLRWTKNLRSYWGAIEAHSQREHTTAQCHDSEKYLLGHAKADGQPCANDEDEDAEQSHD